jgi:hypothetical protein
MESNDPERVLELGRGESPEAGDRAEDAHRLGMGRGEAAGHPRPDGHPRDANPSIRLGVARAETADQDSEVLDVALQVPFEPRSPRPGALGEDHHGAR